MVTPILFVISHMFDEPLSAFLALPPLFNPTEHMEKFLLGAATESASFINPHLA